eukprot:411359_1
MIETKVSESVHHDGRNRGRGENDRTSEVEQLPHNSSAIKVGNEKAKQNRMRSMMGRRFRARVDGSFEHGQFISVDVNGVIHKGVVFNEAKVDYVRRLSKSEAASLGCQLTKKRKVDPAAINNPEPKRMRVVAENRIREILRTKSSFNGVSKSECFSFGNRQTSSEKMEKSD